jgi:CubicO group peptidase (beta-lactamase class C family)
MTGALLASLIEEGQLHLDDPLAMYVPENTNVPDFEGQPILLKHLVTHTSGLPREPDPLTATSRAGLTEAQVIEALNGILLDRAPGTQWEYSNFGYMLLSYVLVHTTGTDLETLMRERLFNPLGMDHAYISQPPPGTTMAVGHTTLNGQPINPWAGPVNLAGEGGVRATLEDMILYAQAQLGSGDPRTVNTLKLTHDLVALGPNYPADALQMGMAWWRSTLDDRTILFHGGNSPGFASLVIIDPEKDRAIIILTDVHVDYGIEEVARHLLAPDQYELPLARRVAVPDLALLQSLQGNYHVDDLEVTLSYSGQTLFATTSDGTEEFGFDSRGDFYPLTLDSGLLTPILDETGQQTFIWMDDLAFVAERLDK